MKHSHLFLGVFTYAMMLRCATFAQDSEITLPTRRPLFSTLEIFSGLGIALNHGNKFVENYQDDNVENTRLLKESVQFGIGATHNFNAFNLHLRIMYDQKGTRSKLDLPENSTISDARKLITSEYTYRYWTVSLVPKRAFFESKRVLFGLGGYLSRIKKVKGNEREHNLKDNSVVDVKFDARIFRHLTSNGGVDSFTWAPGTTGIEKYDYGLCANFLYLININENQLALQAELAYGLLNINRDNEYGLKEINKTISLTIGYRFNVHSKP